MSCVRLWTQFFFDDTPSDHAFTLTGSAIATCVKTLLTLYYNVKQKYIAWCVNYKCIIMTDQLDPLNQRNRSDLFVYFIYLFMVFFWVFFPKCIKWNLLDTEAERQWKYLKVSLLNISFFFYSYIFKVFGIYLWNKPAWAFFCVSFSTFRHFQL